MGVYWILLLVPSLGALLTPFRLLDKSSKKSIQIPYMNKSSQFGFGIFALTLVLVVGLRHEVGGDWFNYLLSLEAALDYTWLESMGGRSDPAYGLLNWTSAQIGSGLYFVNLICGAVFVFGLVTFALSSPQPWLTICVAVPYLVIVVAMGYTRQGVAIGIAMVAMIALQKGLLYRFGIWLLFAALFHKSALILLPLALFVGRKRWGAILGVFCLGILMFLLLLAEQVEFLLSGYITDQYNSSGAGLRVAMNALPAAIFLICRKRFDLDKNQDSFWIWMSIIAIVLIFLLAVSPSSTAVDRVALYWIPLQLFVWSRLPSAMGKNKITQRQWTFVVVVYCFIVQFVWLFYADHSYAWIPYRFYPWEWLWYKI